jgi:hypothetical protein
MMNDGQQSPSDGMYNGSSGIDLHIEFCNMYRVLL